MLRRIRLSFALLTLMVIVPLRADDDYFRPHYQDSHIHYASSRADYRLSLAEAAAASSHSSLDYSRQRVYELDSAIDSQQRILDQLYIDIARGEANLQALRDELDAGAFADAVTGDAVDTIQRDVDEARKAVDAAWEASAKEFRESFAYTTLDQKLKQSAEAIERSPMSIFHRQFHEEIIALQKQVDSLQESNADPNALAAVEVKLNEKLRALATFESIMPWIDPGFVAALLEYNEAQIAMNQLVENFEKLRPQNPVIVAAETKLREAEDRLSAALAEWDLPTRGDLAAAYNNQIIWLNARRRDADRAEANLDSLIYQQEFARSQLYCAERDFRTRLAYVSSAHYCRNVAYAHLHHYDYDDHHHKHVHERRQQWLTNRPGGGPPVKGPFVGPLTEKEYRERERKRGDDDDRRDFDRAQHASFRDDDRDRQREDDRVARPKTLLVPAGQPSVVDMRQQPMVPTRQQVERQQVERQQVQRQQVERPVVQIKPQPTVPTREQVERSSRDRDKNQQAESQKNKSSLQESVRRAEEERQQARKEEAERKERAHIANEERAAAEAQRRQRVEAERQTREARHAEEQARKENARQEQQARQEREDRQRAREAEAAARADAKAREQQQQQQAEAANKQREERQRNSDNDRSNRNDDDGGRAGRSRR